MLADVLCISIFFFMQQDEEVEEVLWRIYNRSLHAVVLLPDYAYGFFVNYFHLNFGLHPIRLLDQWHLICNLISVDSCMILKHIILVEYEFLIYACFVPLAY